MIIVRKKNEKLKEYKARLIEEVKSGRLDAENACEAYEEASLKDMFKPKN